MISDVYTAAVTVLTRRQGFTHTHRYGMIRRDFRRGHVGTYYCTVKYCALEIAFYKFAGEMCPDSLGEIRNRGGRSERHIEIKARRRRTKFCLRTAVQCTN